MCIVDSTWTIQSIGGKIKTSCDDEGRPQIGTQCHDTQHGSFVFEEYWY